mgnify:CR=1 FL=1
MIFATTNSYANGSMASAWLDHGGNFYVGGTIYSESHGNSSDWNTAYTHSQITSGNPHSLDTDDVTEGTNKYFTDERVDDRVAEFLIAGTGISIVEDDNANTLTINGSALYTDEDAQDTIADFLVGGTGITLVEDDENNTLTINGSSLYTCLLYTSDAADE